MATKEAKKVSRKRRKKNRPGYPRKNAVPNRITLRLDPEVAEPMIELCEKRHITQREAVEAAVRAELERPPEPGSARQTDRLYRTGMWIDPALVSELDQRLDTEGTSQRAFIERAVRRWLESENGRSSA